MTNEKAIDKLVVLRGWFEKSEIRDSLDMAISALEGKDADVPSNGTISRTDAIELVKDVCNAIMSGCNSHYDSEVGDEVYDDILEVDAILKCNKEIRKALKGMPSAQPEPQTARVFQEIIVEYPSISTYPEYEGKPYFSIKYTEDGKVFIGYGTYKPEVLSEYLKEYFMPTAQSENLVKESGGLVKDLVNDTISRKSVIVGLDYIINELNKLITDDPPNDVYTDIKNQVEEIKRGVLNIPPADVQPVVHCRECIWLIRGDDRLCEDCVCDNAESPVFATDEYFGCIYGERKGEDNV